MVESALYVYCVAAGEPEGPARLKGLDDRPLRLVRHGGLAVVASEVGLETFCGPGADRRLADPEWIATRAARHGEVVARVFEEGPVLPARLGTIFSTTERLEHFLGIHHDGIAEFLRRVEGSAEWSVKGYLDRGRAGKRLAAKARRAAADALAGKPPGARYFEERKIERTAERELDGWLARIVDRIATRLDGVAAESQDRDLLAREATGKDLDMVLNRALRVPNDRVEAFAGLVDEESDRRGERHGLVLERSGPWPPYSFCPSFPAEDGG